MKRYIRCSYNEESVRDLYNALNRIEKKDSTWMMIQICQTNMKLLQDTMK